MSPILLANLKRNFSETFSPVFHRLGIPHPSARFQDSFAELRELLQTEAASNFCPSILQVIAAEGEQKASRALREASEVIADTPSALQLRYLQVRSVTE